MKKYLIYSDFSDTIAKPSKGDRFLPFEIELGKLAGVDVSSQYEHFLSIRRNKLIPNEDKMKLLLEPFIGHLSENHICQLVSTFKLNKSYIEALGLLKDKLGQKFLDITIVSGTLWQIINNFLISKPVAKYLERSHVSFLIGATKIFFDKDGKYNGKLNVTDRLAFSSASDFPNNFLILGDTAMETYGFGEKLLNVQNFDENTISKRIGKYVDSL